MTSIAKALQKAELLVKGEPAVTSTQELDDAILAYAHEASEPGESGPAALSRLIKARSETLRTLWHAREIATIVESKLHKADPRVERLAEDAEQDLHEYVQLKKRRAESFAESYARLARTDPEFAKRYGRIQEARAFL